MLMTGSNNKKLKQNYKVVRLAGQPLVNGLSKNKLKKSEF